MADKTMKSMCSRAAFLRRENLELKHMIIMNENEVRRLEYMIVEGA